MPADSLPVEFLFTLTADTVSTPRVTIPDGPQGTRVVATVTGGSFEGPRLKGTVADAAAGDWLTVRPDGSLRLDVRLVLRTDDGAAILMTYNGIGTEVDGRVRIRTAPLFETGDERYRWLTRVQAVAHGERLETGVRYDVYALT